MKTKSFTYDGRSLEVRAARIDDQIVVRVFENGSPVNSINYSVSLETAVDALPWDLVADLMDTAEGDFIRWSEWLKEEKKKRRDTNPQT